jgi:hypothetical protein
MTELDRQVSETFLELAEERGVDPFVDVIPSASGGALPTSLPEKEFRAHTKRLYDGSDDVFLSEKFARSRP